MKVLYKTQFRSSLKFSHPTHTFGFASSDAQLCKCTWSRCNDQGDYGKWYLPLKKPYLHYQQGKYKHCHASTGNLIYTNSRLIFQYHISKIHPGHQTTSDLFSCPTPLSERRGRIKWGSCLYHFLCSRFRSDLLSVSIKPEQTFSQSMPEPMKAWDERVKSVPSQRETGAASLSVISVLFIQHSIHPAALIWVQLLLLWIL